MLSPGARCLRRTHTPGKVSLSVMLAWRAACGGRMAQAGRLNNPASSCWPIRHGRQLTQPTQAPRLCGCSPTSCRSTLIVSAKAKWPGLAVSRTLGLYFGSAQFASATSSSGTCLGTKVEGWEIHAGQVDVSVFLGEAAGTAGDNAVQTAALATASTSNDAYREISLRGAWGTASGGSNVITLESARLELAWGTQ
jgi:hypothetical protein